MLPLLKTVSLAISTIVQYVLTGNGRPAPCVPYLKLFTHRRVYPLRSLFLVVFKSFSELSYKYLIMYDTPPILHEAYVR